MTRFRDELWPHIQPTYDAILEHPFLVGLTDGSLDEAAFQYYVLQDALYLRDYARALAVAGAKAIQDDDVVQFCTDAANAILVERSLHDGFITAFGITAAEAAAVEATPATVAYTSYLLRVAHQGSFAEAVAVVLPCYWIYARVGEALLAMSADRATANLNPNYARWIGTYAGDDFQQTVQQVLAVVDRLGEELSGPERERFIAHVVLTSKYEWMFWDAAWRQQTWPI